MKPKCTKRQWKESNTIVRQEITDTTFDREVDIMSVTANK